MGKLVKTGEKVTVQPRDIIYLYRFIKEVINWDRKEYFDFLDKEVWSKGIQEGGDIYMSLIIPRFLLVPDYRYSTIPTTMFDVTEIRGGDLVTYEKLSTFSIYEFIDGAEGSVDRVSIGAHLVPYALSRVGLMTLSLGMFSSDWTIGIFRVDVEDPKETISKLEGGLKTFKCLLGNSYYRYLFEHQRKSKKLIESMTHLEDSLLIFVNFLYALYTGEFTSKLPDSDLPDYKLFKPFVKTLQSFGKSFGEALLNMAAFGAIS
jgi:hypothetical protein